MFTSTELWILRELRNSTCWQVSPLAMMITLAASDREIDATALACTVRYPIQCFERYQANESGEPNGEPTQADARRCPTASGDEESS